MTNTEDALAAYERWVEHEEAIIERFAHLAYRIGMPPSRCEVFNATFYYIHGDKVLFRDADNDVIELPLDLLLNASDGEWRAYVAEEQEKDRLKREQAREERLEQRHEYDRNMLRQLMIAHPDVVSETQR